MACDQAEKETFSSLCTQPGASPLFLQPLRVKCPGCTLLHCVCPWRPHPGSTQGWGTARGQEARTLL